MGFRVLGLEIKAWGDLWIRDLGCRVWGLGSRVEGFSVGAFCFFCRGGCWGLGFTEACGPHFEGFVGNGSYYGV